MVHAKLTHVATTTVRRRSLRDAPPEASLDTVTYPAAKRREMHRQVELKLIDQRRNLAAKRDSLPVQLVVPIISRDGHLPDMLVDMPLVLPVGHVTCSTAIILRERRQNNRNAALR